MCECRGARYRRTTERRAVIPWLEAGCCPFVCENGTNRQAVGERFRDRNYIWSHCEPLESKQRSGSSHSTLDFIENQECAALVAKTTSFGEKVLARDVHAAFSLDGFDDECSDLTVDRAAQRRGITEWNEVEAARERPKPFPVGAVVGCGKRAQRAAMKRSRAGENLGAAEVSTPVRELARELDCGLVRFGP